MNIGKQSLNDNKYELYVYCISNVNSISKTFAKESATRGTVKLHKTPRTINIISSCGHDSCGYMNIQLGTCLCTHMDWLAAHTNCILSQPPRNLDCRFTEHMLIWSFQAIFIILVSVSKKKSMY